MDNETYLNEVRHRIKRAVRDGNATFLDILARLDGADPRLVRQIVDEEEIRARPDEFPSLSEGLSSTRSRLLQSMPVPDPALGQWWYTPETQERLVRRAIELRNSSNLPRVLCVGSPTVAPLLNRAGCYVTVLEEDPDIVASLNEHCEQARSKIIRHDVSLIPEGLPLHDIAIIDPPWYPRETNAFLLAAIKHVEPGGHIMASIPPLLTRPGIADERQRLLQFVSSQGCELMFLDRGSIRYVVPRFEEAAFSNVVGFVGMPWRVADLLICRVNTTVSPSENSDSSDQISLAPLTKMRYSREPREFRVFCRETASAPQRTIIVRANGFSENVSRRAISGEFPDVWTSEKAGAYVEDAAEAACLLKAWQSGQSREEAATRLSVERKISRDTALEVAAKYDEILGIWARFHPGTATRRPDSVRDTKSSVRSVWAATESPREYGRDSDGFRDEFSRDRDRILWCGSFRKLSGKTQVFPVEDGDQLRQRLAHSIEVMQLATTMAESFGLDRDLVEAGSLAHDIGHTPFGHAGEHALDQLFVEIAPRSPGFNHYEHGVDVVRFLEGPYQYVEGQGHMGLNLTPEVSECIFKHTYCHGGSRISHDEIRARSKHKSYIANGYCHIEGQAVRLADKISYLISDIEDGIRLNAITERALTACRLFHRPPIDLAQPKGESLLMRFVMQRRNVIKVLMEDAINETGRRLAKISSPTAVRNQTGYLVDHSPNVHADVAEVWKRLQAGMLHKDARVVRANMKAARIVTQLCLAFAFFPELVASQFRAEHKRLWGGNYMKYYRDLHGARVDIPTDLTSFLLLDKFIGLESQVGNRRSVAVEELVMAKDFVASLTDIQATSQHREFFG